MATVVRRLLALAEDYYASAEHGLHYIAFRPRVAIVVASRVYRSIGLRLLRRHGGDALWGRTVVPLWERGVWVVRALLAVFSPVILGLSTRPHRPELHRAFPEVL